uniref:RING-type domain-containing protein n=1 Tax=Ictidomys tridecemlineatus TaxID=43179 RepID=I3N033_ICTTR
SGGYDLNLFASPPDCNFLCSVCHGVLKRPVRLPCSHIFCKKCILRWLARQNTCPCCRKEVKRKKMVHVNKLRKTIGRLEVKVAQSTDSHHPWVGQSQGQACHLQRKPSTAQASADLAKFESYTTYLCDLGQFT